MKTVQVHLITWTTLVNCNYAFHADVIVNPTSNTEANSRTAYLTSFLSSKTEWSTAFWSLNARLVVGWFSSPFFVTSKKAFRKETWRQNAPKNEDK